MLDALRLRSLEIASLTETVSSIEMAAHLLTRAAGCPHCGGKIESKGVAEPMTVWDTPALGKHVRIELRGRRYKCRSPGCRTFTDRGADVHPDHGMTWRLWRYIRRLALKSSIKDITRITGMTEEQVWPVAMGLAEQLVNHKFPTPRIVAVDDIRFGKKRRFTVIYNGENGHPLGIIEKLDAAGIGKKLHAIIDPSQATVFVSDMNGSNVKLAESSFAGIPHVADKWHVLDKMQRPMSRVVNQTANKLAKGPAAELKSWKSELEGRFAAEDARRWRDMKAGKGTQLRQRDDGQQMTFTLASKMEILVRYPAVRLVYHARLLLRHVYRASTSRTAEARLNRFLAFGGHPDMPEEAAKAIKLLGDCRKPILAYFDVMWQHHDGRYRGATTNQAEARNGKIKDMWKRSRGIRNATYLNLRVVFEPYVLGTTLLVCDACGTSKVINEVEGLRRAGLSVAAPCASHCTHCVEKEAG